MTLLRSRDSIPTLPCEVASVATLSSLLPFSTLARCHQPGTTVLCSPPAPYGTSHGTGQQRGGLQRCTDYDPILTISQKHCQIVSFQIGLITMKTDDIFLAYKP